MPNVLFYGIQFLRDNNLSIATEADTSIAAELVHTLRSLGDFNQLAKDLLERIDHGGLSEFQQVSGMTLNSPTL